MRIGFIQRLRKAPHSGSHQQAESLGEHAWLQGGPERVAESWLAALIDGDWLNVTHKPDGTPGRVVRVQEIAPPLDSELSGALYTLPDSGDISTFQKAWQPRMGQLQAGLVDKGLLASSEDRKSCAERATAIVTILAMSGLLLMGAGIPKMTFLMAGGLLPLFFGFGTLGGAPRLTQEGLDQRERFRRLNTANERAPTQGNLGMAVALGGMIVLVGTPFQAMAYPVAHRAEGSSSGGCGSATGIWGLDGDTSAGETGNVADGGAGGSGDSSGGDAGGGGCGGCGG